MYVCNSSNFIESVSSVFDIFSSSIDRPIGVINAAVGLTSVSADKHRVSIGLTPAHDPGAPMDRKVKHAQYFTIVMPSSQARSKGNFIM